MLFLKFRLTFVCKYKYSKQTSNVFYKKISVFSRIFLLEQKTAKKTLEERGLKILRLLNKALTVLNTNIQFYCKNKGSLRFFY